MTDARIPTSREIMLAGGVDPDAPFEVGPFPAEMRQALPSADDIRAVAERFDPAAFEPHIKRAVDEIYQLILDACEGYLRENVDYNIGASIAMLNYDNQKMRTELFEVDRALGCMSLGHDARLSAIKEVHDRWRQASAEVWRLREKLAVVDPACREVLDYINGNAPGLAYAVEQRLLPLLDDAQGSSEQ